MAGGYGWSAAVWLQEVEEVLVGGVAAGGQTGVAVAGAGERGGSAGGEWPEGRWLEDVADPN